MLIVSCSRSNYKNMQQPRWQLRRSAIRRLSSATSPNKDHPVDRRNVTREFKIPRRLTATKTSHEKVNSYFFSVSIVIIPTSLLCQMQANSSGAEFLSTISKFMRRMNFVVACLRSPQNVKLGIFKDSRAVDGKEMYKKA